MSDKVKVKILKPVGQYEHGEVAEVSKEEAEHLLKPRHRHLGGDDKQAYHVAVEAEKFEKLQNEGANESLAEAKARGHKNVVDSSEKKSSDESDSKNEASKKDSDKNSKSSKK